MKTSWLAAALTYVGAVVGAGFASGQEVYQFFGRYGSSGLVGILFAGALFALMGFLALERGRRSPTETLSQFLHRTYPAPVVRFIATVVMIFLLVGLGVVSAGGGAALGKIFGWPVLVGAFLTTLVVIMVVTLGTRGVLRANVVLVPYLIALVVLVGILSWRHPAVAVTVSGPRLGWALSALLYLSYNIFTGIVVLLALGRHMRSTQQSALAAAAGAVILSGLAVVEHHALARLTSIGDLPLVDLAYRLHSVWGRLYAVSLWVALFTTGIAEAYALVEQLNRKVLLVVALTPLVGLMGFQRLVAGLYPIMGIVAVILWLPLIYQPKRQAPGG